MLAVAKLALRAMSAVIGLILVGGRYLGSVTVVYIYLYPLILIQSAPSKCVCQYSNRKSDALINLISLLCHIHRV